MFINILSVERVYIGLSKQKKDLELIVDDFIKSIQESSYYRRRLANMVLYLSNYDVSYTRPFPALCGNLPNDILQHVVDVSSGIKMMRLYRKLKRKLYKRAQQKYLSATESELWRHAVDMLITDAEFVIKSSQKKLGTSDKSINKLISLYRVYKTREWRKQQTRRT